MVVISKASHKVNRKDEIKISEKHEWYRIGIFNGWTTSGQLGPRHLGHHKDWHRTREEADLFD